MAKKEITVEVLNCNGEKVNDLALDSKIFGVEVKDQAIYNACKLYLANSRQATAKTKTRSEVSGGGKKPWRQKGTGRARAGSTRSPIWVGGGNVFGPKGTQNFKLEQNRKEYKNALNSALTLKVNDKALYVIDELKLDGKTKTATNLIKALKLVGKTLIVNDKVCDKCASSISNLKKVALIDVKQLNVYHVMDAKNVVFTVNALKEVK